MSKKGNISIHTENIFPIIKKWLYSDKDIFIRELISNACDAVNKHKKLVSLGEAQKSEEEYRVNVYIDKDKNALVFEDNGIGMTEEEVEKYINQVAFSGAEDFFNKYKDNTIYAAINGSGYLNVIKHILEQGILCDVNINIFSDSDRDPNYYKNMVKTLLPFVNDIRLFYNSIGKDYGVPVKDIQLKEVDINYLK